MRSNVFGEDSILSKSKLTILRFWELEIELLIEPVVFFLS